MSSTQIMSYVQLKGTIIHFLIGAVLGLCSVLSPGTILFGFWMRELGELKSKLPGSIWTLEKNYKIILRSFHISILPQWLAPGIGGLLGSYLL